MAREWETPRADNPKQNLTWRKLTFAILLIVMGVAITLGLVLNHVLNDGTPHTARYRVDCHPEKNASETRCKERGCIWVATLQPACSFPERYGYVMASEPEETPNGVKVKVKRIDTPPLYGMKPDINLTVLIEYHTEHRLRIKIFPTGASRYEVPEEALSITSPSQPSSESTRVYDVTFQTEPIFGVIVTRRDTNTTIFHTGVPGMAMYPQFLQISTLLNNSYLYGFGEHRHQSFRHDMNHRRWSIFTRDVGPDNDWNLYGAHPVYMNVENDGKAHMVFLKNSNAMEVTLQPDPSITFRTIGGILDFYIFLGDSPSHAVSLYTQAIGLPVLPPYWSLGFQLSRWGYTNLTDMEMVIQRNRAARVPYDVQWADIDSLFNKLVFTVDKQEWSRLSDVVNDLKTHNQHFVVIVDPGVGANQVLIDEAKINSPGYNMFHDGERAGVYIKDANGANLIGEVWPGITAYPDYTNASIVDWYLKYVQFYRNNQSIDVGALWIDMNEPSNFRQGSVNGCSRNQWDYPPYVPRILGAEPDGKMYDKTLCMTAQQTWGKHYDVHNLYAHSMAMRTNQVLSKVFPGKRPWAMTRSSFAGTGHYVTKWTGDNQSKWPAMHWSIIVIMEFSMFGFALNGADICGFWYETTYDLCIRWHQLGAFYPFARNHNGRGDPPQIFRHQDPAAWDDRFVSIVKKPLMTRYRLLPYLYSLMYRAHLFGETVMRPLLFEFPTDMRARDIDQQFLLGPALLISPVLKENATSVDAYFPNARWYEYFTGEEVTPVNQIHTLNTPLEDFNLHVRGGHVIPWQSPSVTTLESRKNPMGLIVALDQEHKAQGMLYLDDGVSEVNNSYTLITFSMQKAEELIIQVTSSDYNVTKANGAPLKLETLEIYGLASPPASVLVDGQAVPHDDVRYARKIVKILNLQMDVMESHVITWLFY